jgi:hypothetical protein
MPGSRSVWSRIDRRRRRSRSLLGALVVLVGGLALAAAAYDRGLGLAEVVAAVAVVLLLASRVEGRGPRYLGGGAAAGAVGLALILAARQDLAPYELALLAGLLGLALLLIFAVDVRLVLGAAIMLLLIAAAQAYETGFPAVLQSGSVVQALDRGWPYGALLAAYGVLQAMRSVRGVL